MVESDNNNSKGLMVFPFDEKAHWKAGGAEVPSLPHPPSPPLLRVESFHSYLGKQAQILGVAMYCRLGVQRVKDHAKFMRPS